MDDQNRFRGVIAPVLTPFREDGKPDVQRLVSHAHWLLDNGCTALAPFGTTSEANSLSLDERMALLEGLIEGGIEPTLLMPGTGLCAIGDVVRLTKHALMHGCRGVLVLPPFYYKGVSDNGIFAHFRGVMDGVADDRLRVYLYHIPPVAQVGFSVDLVARLIDAYPKQVVGLKDSSGDWSNTKALIKAFPGFDVFSGSELTLLDNLRTGGVGCISATANVNPSGLRAIFDDCQSDVVGDLQASASAIRRFIEAYPVIPFLKAIVAAERDDPQWAATRPPLVPMPEITARSAIGDLRNQIGFKGAGMRAA